MPTPKSEHVAELMNVAGNLISANGEHERGPELARFTVALLTQIDTDIKANETMKRRGHQGQRKALDVLAPMLNAYADALAGHKPVSTEPIVCTARNQLDAVCMRTEAGHTAHAYPPVDPTDRVPPLAQPVPDPTGIATCGMTYPGSADACLLDPAHVPKRESHQARNGRWPVSDDDLNAWSVAQPIATQIAQSMGVPAEILLALPEAPDMEDVARETIYEPLKRVHASDKDQILAFLKGETDELVPEVLLVQPDPFADAGVVPDSEIRRDYSWRPEPDPRPLWLPPDYVNGHHHDPITSIRVTAVRTGEQCGMAYRLISRDQVSEVPAWWNVGGHTLHACAQGIEQNIIGGDQPREMSEDAARALWDLKWPDAVALTERESPGFERRHWRAASKGTEGADWWNEVGPHMVRDYTAASARWHADGWSILHTPQGPAMELEMRSPLPTGGELVGHLDQAWFRLDEGDQWEVRIRDLKTSSKMPEDEWQLDAYTYLLYQRLRESGMDLSRCTFSVVHYDARNAKDAEARKIDIAQQPVGIQTVYRASSVLRMHEANNYPASPGGTWRDPCYLCAVRYACPIMALK